MRNAKIGDPLDRATQVGPQARHDLRDQLHRQVEASIERGAKCCSAAGASKAPARSIRRPCSPT